MPTPVDVVLRLHAALQEGGIAHAFGGAIAYGFVAQPRGTVDVDLNVFCDEAEIPHVVEVLGRAGCEIDLAEVRRSVAERGDFHARCLGYRVDAFTPFHPFHDSVWARVRSVNLVGTTIPVLSAEDLIVFKAIFDRPKDWVDIEAMIRALAGAYDSAYVERWLSDILPPGDSRLERLRALARS